ncbi:MAG TPA: methyltransferase domain-containing protein [Gemmatimonadaceae bacterium]|nr:methyltransferase domain-containing protein [Gemmatimonadaceae bacterium]
MSPAAQAFDAVAEQFDERYGAWLSVAAQRRAVRAELAKAFPIGARVLEIGGGTGDDAQWLIERGRDVLLTDVSPRMVRIAAEKLRPLNASPPCVAPAETLGPLADELGRQGLPLFEGVFSNFAGLNCVPDLEPVARGLARLVRPGGRVLIVIFGVWPPGEWLVQLARRDVKSAFRRLSRGDVHARLGGRDFVVRYHRPADVHRAVAPWFRVVSRIGIGVLVPPSAAEPAISRYPKVLSALEAIDRVVKRPLAALGDHVLYTLARSDAPA